MKFLFFFLLALPLMANITCTNSPSDLALIQAAINGSGTVILNAGTCNLSSGTIVINNAVVLRGINAPTVGVRGVPSGNAVLNGTGGSLMLDVESDNVTIQGLTWQGGGIYVNGLPRNNFNFIYNNLQNMNALNAFGSNGVFHTESFNNSHVDHNIFRNLWYGTYPSFGSIGGGSDSFGPAGFESFHGIQNSTVTDNLFDTIGNDALNTHLNSGTNATGGNSIYSGNEFVRVHRSNIELQGWNGTATISNNYIHDEAKPFFNSWCMSMPGGGSPTTVINNTCVMNTGVTASTFIAGVVETQNYPWLIQGNVGATINPVSGASNTWQFGNIGNIGTGSGPGAVVFQNNQECGSTPMITTAIEGSFPPPFSSTNNYLNASTCPSGLLSLTSAMTPSYNGVVNSGGVGTFSFGMVSNFSINQAQYLVDGSPISSQAIQDVSSSFGSDRTWRYHVLITYASYSGTTHTLAALFTDVSGNTSTASTTFVGTGSSSFPILSSSVSTPDGLAALTLSQNSSSAITVTSNIPVTWALASGSVGTLVTVDSTHATYAPPAHVLNRNQIQGCPVFAPDSIYNQDITSALVIGNSATQINNVSAILPPDYPFSVSELNRMITYADSSTPTRVFRGFNDPVNLTLPWPNVELSSDLNQKMEAGNLVGVTNSGGSANQTTDHHLLEVNKSDCTFTEIYGAYQPLASTITCSDSSSGCNASSTARYSGLNYQFNSSPGTVGTDAAGLSALSVLWRNDELYNVYYSTGPSGKLTHATRYTSCVSCLSDSPPLWPAVNQLFSASVSVTPAAGARLRLKPTYFVGGVAANVCTGGSTIVNGLCQILVNTAKSQGTFTSDIGSSNSNSFEAALDPNVNLAFQEFNHIPLKDSATSNINWEIVDETGLQESGSTIRVNAQNSVGVTATNFATIAATNGSDTTSLPVFIQGIGIGMQRTELNIQAGSPNYQLNWWIQPLTANQGATWSLISGVGSVTSGGLFSPPSSASSLTQTILKGTATADSSSSVYVIINNLPNGANPAGTLRFAMGSFTFSGITDANGNLWNSCCNQFGLFSYPGAVTLPAVGENAIFASQWYAFGNDIVYEVDDLPNGNYDISWYFAINPQTTCAGFFCQGSLTPAQAGLSNPFDFEAQNQVAKSWFNPIAGNTNCNYIFMCPVIVTIPAKVTNNSLYLALRERVNDNSPFRGSTNTQKNPTYNGLKIVPNTSTSPFLEIDTNGQFTIQPGQTLFAFSVVDHFFGLSQPLSVAWSLVNPPSGASINSSGILSLSGGACNNSNFIQVQAVASGHTALYNMPISGCGVTSIQVH